MMSVSLTGLQWTVSVPQYLADVDYCLYMYAYPERNWDRTDDSIMDTVYFSWRNIGISEKKYWGMLFTFRFFSAVPMVAR